MAHLQLVHSMKLWMVSDRALHSDVVWASDPEQAKRVARDLKGDPADWKVRRCRTDLSQPALPFTA